MLCSSSSQYCFKVSPCRPMLQPDIDTYIYSLYCTQHVFVQIVSICPVPRPWFDWRIKDPAFEDPTNVTAWLQDKTPVTHPWTQLATDAGHGTDGQQLQVVKRKRDHTNRRRGGKKYQNQKRARQVDAALSIMGSLSRSLERSLHAHLPAPPPPPPPALPWDDDDDGGSTEDDAEQEVEWVD